ncbi:histidine kinase [Mesorhizobium sp. Root695]|uniref:histidine kinase n=1 Tax=Mesorhizobium sp. Root695 TaxID=1736589 RepID=UPI000A5343EA|nr:histidine kinase [Mesorhizobium sp. Root695]
MLENSIGKKIRLTRHFFLLVAVVSIVMVTLAWWIDQCVTVTAPGAAGGDAAPSRIQAVVAIALAWAIVLSALVLAFRGHDIIGGFRNPRPDSLNQKEIGQRIHDGPAQMLTFVMLRLDELDDLLRPTEGTTEREARQIIQDLKSASLDALNDLRQISRQLTLTILSPGSADQ